VIRNSLVHFASNDSAQRWVADHPGTFVLTVDEAFGLATRPWPALFRDALASTPNAVDGVAGGDR